MSNTILLLLLIFSVPFLFIYHKILTFLPEVPIIQDTWWTDVDPAEEDKNIHPFKINVSQETLDDLKYRLDHTRPFPKPLQNNQIYGFNGDLAQEILDYWRTKYNWRKRESRINEYPHYVTSIQGLKIHFIHYKPSNVSANLRTIPLLISHGWPSSFVEFLEVLPILTTPRKDRDFVFEVVVPDIPGFGFSDPPQKPGFGAPEAALVFKKLMNRLGHHKFYVHGGDLGMLILKAMATSLKDSVLGFHSNMCVSLHPLSLLKYLLGSLYPRWIKRESHREMFYPISQLFNLTLMEFGYLHLQSSKPDTYGIAIDDTPMGMAVQYLEKFSTGGYLNNRLRKDGGLQKKYNLTVLLDNIMIYWITKTGTTSYRFYSETFHGSKFLALAWLPVRVPTACLSGPYDIVSPDGIVEEVFPNIVHKTEQNVGHFLGFENPKLLANDLFEAFGKMDRVMVERCLKFEEKLDL